MFILYDGMHVEFKSFQLFHDSTLLELGRISPCVTISRLFHSPSFLYSTTPSLEHRQVPSFDTFRRSKILKKHQSNETCFLHVYNYIMRFLPSHEGAGVSVKADAPSGQTSIVPTRSVALGLKNYIVSGLK